MKLVILFLLAATIAPLGMSMFMEYGFGFGFEGGIQKSTCSEKFKVTYTKHKLIGGVKTIWNQTDVISTSKCCEGYTFRNGDCFPIDPEHPCHNISCSVVDAECVMVKRCAHKIAIFMKDDKIVRECHPPGYLNLLTCTEHCTSNVCDPDLCQKLNPSEVECKVVRGCSCKALWQRKSDSAIMDCKTGEVQKPCK